MQDQNITSLENWPKIFSILCSLPKIHALVDALEYPLKFEITSGAHHDITQAKPLTASLFNTQLLADRAYGSSDLRACLKSRSCAPVIPYKSNALNPEPYDVFLYKERNIVERFFLKIKHFRRLFSCFDKKLLNFKAFLTIAGASLGLSKNSSLRPIKHKK